MLRFWCTHCCFSALTLSAWAVPAPMLFSRRQSNQTQIAFALSGDIWIVERAGGEARRLRIHPAERIPELLADGSQLAFSRQVGGNGTSMSCRQRAAKHPANLRSAD